MVMIIREVVKAIDQFMEMTGIHNKKDIMVVMSKDFKELCVHEYKGMWRNKPPELKDDDLRIAGVEIMIHEKLESGFGIFEKSCKEHIEKHIEEMMEEVKKDNQEEPEKEIPDMIICDLCKHPVTTKLLNRHDVVCPWCGDVNDIQDHMGVEGDD